jgi:hypothetical protein
MTTLLSVVTCHPCLSYVDTEHALLCIAVAARGMEQTVDLLNYYPNISPKISCDLAAQFQ